MIASANSSVFRSELVKDQQRHQAALDLAVQRVKAEIDAHYDRWRFEVQSTQEENLAILRGLIDFALAALRGIILVNGGAAVAVLAFLGHIWSPDPDGGRAVAIAIKPALLCFVTGTCAGVTASALAYFSQVLFREHRANWPGAIMRGIAILVAVGGLVAFGIGAFWAADAFGAIPATN
jgi:hypothetical protein